MELMMHNHINDFDEIDLSPLLLLLRSPLPKKSSIPFVPNEETNPTRDYTLPISDQLTEMIPRCTIKDEQCNVEHFAIRSVV